jgi:hypothetical protein
MPIQKMLKIAGSVLLAFFILYFGLMFVLSGMDKTSDNALSIESGAGSVGVFQAMTKSVALAPMAAGEIALDSSATPSRDYSANTVTATVDKKIIKTGNLSLKVEKAETAAESIANIAKVNKGEVANSSFYESGQGVKSGSITVRVPYKNFDATFAEIKKVATQVVSESANAQDITADYIDLEARLKNTRAEEVSFLALLNRSGKIEEILAVTKEIARVRGETEQLEGQLRYLSSQTDMSTITANISEDIEIASASKDWRPWQVVKLSAKQLITAGQNFIDGLIAFLIVVLPMLLIYGLIIWLLYVIGKKVYNKYVNKQ